MPRDVLFRCFVTVGVAADVRRAHADRVGHQPRPECDLEPLRQDEAFRSKLERPLNRIDRRRGILVSLTLLSIPTALLAVAPDLTTFTVLRVMQGLCMSTAFALTRVRSDLLAPSHVNECL